MYGREERYIQRFGGETSCRLLEKPRHTWEDNIVMYIEVGWGVD
jgi:hypothetical protein